MHKKVNFAVTLKEKRRSFLKNVDFDILDVGQLLNERIWSFIL